MYSWTFFFTHLLLQNSSLNLVDGDYFYEDFELDIADELDALVYEHVNRSTPEQALMNRWKSNYLKKRSKRRSILCTSDSSGRREREKERTDLLTEEVLHLENKLVVETTLLQRIAIEKGTSSISTHCVLKGCKSNF